MVARTLRKSLNNGAALGREAMIADHVPYLRHVDDQTLRTKEGFLLSAIKLDGFCFQTADQSEINLRLSARNTLVRALNGHAFKLGAQGAIGRHLQRGEAILP